MPSLSQVKVTDFFHRLVSRPVPPTCPSSLQLLPNSCSRLCELRWGTRQVRTLTATQPALYHLSPPRDPYPCSQPRIDGSW